MIPVSTTTLAILLGMAIYPFFANNIPNQRQNASAVIGVLLLGFIIFGYGPLAQLTQGTTLYTVLKIGSFVFFASGFLGRKRGSVTAQRSSFWPFCIGILAASVETFLSYPAVFVLSSMIQAVCLYAMTRSYDNLPQSTWVKASFFILLYCAVNTLFHINTTNNGGIKTSMSVVFGLFYLLLISSVLHMCFQDFARTRIKQRWNERTKVDQDLMKLAFKGRRVLKDFRHDLRQPLSTLGILASVGKAISKDAEVTARYQHIQTAQKALKNMLEDFFDQLGNAIRYPVEETLVPLRNISIDEVLSPLIEEYRMLAQAKHLQIRYMHTDHTVWSNKEALSKIVRNGLDNAIKYTTKGGVVVGLRRRAGRFCLQIADTGSGVENDKVAEHNKGWGHGSQIIKDLSGQILAKTECKNRYQGGHLVGSVFEVLLPGEAEVSHRWKLPNHLPQNHFEAEVMALSNEHLIEIQKHLPTKGFDKVNFSLRGAYKNYWNALKRGMSSVYIMYAGDPNQKEQALAQIKLLGSLLDFEPCCIFIYNASNEGNAQIEFTKEMIYIPLNSIYPHAGLQVIEELFPKRDKEISEKLNSEVVNNTKEKPVRDSSSSMLSS